MASQQYEFKPTRKILITSTVILYPIHINDYCLEIIFVCIFGTFCIEYIKHLVYTLHHTLPYMNHRITIIMQDFLQTSITSGEK